MNARTHTHTERERERKKERKREREALFPFLFFFFVDRSIVERAAKARFRVWIRENSFRPTNRRETAAPFFIFGGMKP